MKFNDTHVFIGGLVVACLISVLQHVRYDPPERYFSPDKKYTLEIRKDRLYMGFPGSSSDAPAQVTLIKNADGRIVFRKRVIMLQFVENVVWSDEGVYINPLDRINYDGSIYGDPSRTWEFLPF